jgi:hypothetical protein
MEMAGLFLGKLLGNQKTSQGSYETIARLQSAFGKRELVTGNASFAQGRRVS